MFDTLTERGENVDDLIATKQAQSEGMSYDKASREVVAEAMTDILPDAHFAEKLATKHKNIFYKLLDMLKEFVADLKAYFNSIGKNPSREANALKEQVGDSVKYLDHIVKLFDKVAIEAVENYQAAAAVEETDSNGLTDDEKGALLAYKSGGSYSLNAKLRDGTELDEYEQSIVDNLDSALEKLPTYKGEVYRVILFDGFGDKEARDAYVADHALGEMVRYKAYISSSTIKEVYDSGVDSAVYHVIQSASGRNLEGYGNNFESEVLFTRENRFVTDRIEYDEDGTPNIYLTEVANEQQTAETQTADRRGAQGNVSRDNSGEPGPRAHTAEETAMQSVQAQNSENGEMQPALSGVDSDGGSRQRRLQGVQAEVGEDPSEERLTPSTPAIRARAEETESIYGGDTLSDVSFMDRSYVVQKKSDGTFTVSVTGRGGTGFVANDVSKDGFTSFADAAEYAIRWILTNDLEFKTRWKKTYAEFTKTSSDETANPKEEQSLDSVDEDTVQEQSRSYLKKDEYPTYGVHWGIEEGVMSKADARAVWEAIANIQKRGYHSYPTTVNGEYFVEGDDVLMVVAADYRNPIVETIYKFNDTYKANISYAKELIINARGDPTWHGEAVRFIEDNFGSGYITEYHRHESDAWQNRGGKGANSRADFEGEIQYQRRTNTLTDRDALYMAAEKLGEDVAEMSEAERDALQIFKDRLSRLYDLQEERVEL